MNLLHKVAAAAQVDPQRAAVLEDCKATSYGEVLAVACAAGKMRTVTWTCWWSLKRVGRPLMLSLI